MQQPSFGNTIDTNRASKKDDINNNRNANNIQRTESLDKYRSLPQSLLV